MEKLLVNTPQNVNVEYTLASVGSRILAVGFDYLVMIGYVIILYRVMNMLGANKLDGWDYAGLMMFLLLPVLFYHLWMETYFQGQTLGMKLFKLKVVRLDGSRATAYEYFIRWAMNIVDVWMLSGLIGLLSIVLSKKSQRIGDLAASTTVISLKPRLKLIETSSESLTDNYQVVFPNVIKLTDKDMVIIKNSFQKALQKKDAVVLQKLAQQIKKVTELENVQMDNQTFIQTIIQDHYHLFKSKM